ncbi:methyl-accepting chemotaxis protein [Aestuariirhabdus sp. Z084]|uniref:methyl-accepting chemotaxis protein n=1 Tax=Aestuariirhabdus haliotis TaxID=2918751 RepID=UPI00201B3C29|nr:methyl-accepting chemotaxis protein [Aestuariirhabdus haliotis]MCL6414044.1 methyl-accepting chemotaxis protein [Aestuariirhabdus haliotis]MCL6417977.1 methyl-accepting chemotaxis protein [Aestuariirhabdus haliotis]
MKSLSLKYKFALGAGTISAILLLSLYMLMRTISGNAITTLIDGDLGYRSQSVTSELENWFQRKVDTVAAVKEQVEMVGQDATQFRALLRGSTSGQDFFDVYLGFEDGDFYFSDEAFEADQKANNSYPVRERGWYIDSKRKQTLDVSEPYSDAETGDLLLTVTLPLILDGKFAGVAAGDMTLVKLNEIVNALEVPGGGQAYLVDRSGQIIAAENKELFLKPIETIDDELTSPDLERITLNDEALLVIRAAVGETGWTLIMMVPEEVIFSELTNMQTLGLIFLILAILIMVALVLVYVQVQMRPITTIVEAIKEIAQGEGDLTRKLESSSKDELGELTESYNYFIDSLRELVTNILKPMEHLHSSADTSAQLADTSANGAQEQVRAIDSLVTAMNQMTATAQDVAKNIAETAQFSEQASESAHNGEAEVERTKAAMDTLNVQMTDATGIIHQLRDQSENINEVVSVISSISGQTNLLALNASIEAARAGEAGRGFAVVADEVRSLASRTQEATTEISTIIEKLQTDSQRAVGIMDEAKQMAEGATGQADLAKNELAEVVRNMNEIASMSAQIASAAEQQSSVSEEINRHIMGISDIAHETSSGAEQAQNEAGSIRSLASEVARALARFKI